MRPHSLPSGAPHQSHTREIFQHRLVGPRGHTPQVQVKVERSVETNVVENKGSQGGAHLQGRDGWTLPPRASSGPGAAQPGPVLTGRAQDEREHREAGARAGLVGLLLSHGRRVAAQEIWGHSPRSQGRSSCHGWTHVDRAASSTCWTTPTHPRPRSHVSLPQKVSGRACQDPSSPVPRVGGGALEAIIQPPAATKARRLRPSTQQPRPEIQPHARSPSCVGAQHSVLGGGLWSLQGWALDNLSPNLSSLQQHPCIPRRRSHLMTEGVKAKALHGPGHGSGHTSGHHTCHVSRVRTLESGGCRQEECPSGPGPQPRSG